MEGRSVSQPARDGAVLPILHLNETRSRADGLGRAVRCGIKRSSASARLRAAVRRRQRPGAVHATAAARRVPREIRAIQGSRGGAADRAVLAGDRPAYVRRADGARGRRVPVEGTFRAHQVPLTQVRENPEHLARLESGCGATAPRSASTPRASGPALAALRPEAELAWAPAAHANGGRVLVRARRSPAGAYAIDRRPRRRERAESTRRLGELLRDVMRRNRGRLPALLSRRDELNRLGAVFEVEDRCLHGRAARRRARSARRRVMQVLSKHNCQGWLEGYL